MSHTDNCISLNYTYLRCVNSTAYKDPSVGSALAMCLRHTTGVCVCAFVCVCVYAITSAHTQTRKYSIVLPFAWKRTKATTLMGRVSPRLNAALMMALEWLWAYCINYGNGVCYLGNRESVMQCRSTDLTCRSSWQVSFCQCKAKRVMLFASFKTCKICLI